MPCTYLAYQLLHHRDVASAAASGPPASEQVLQRVSTALNERMHQLFVDPATRSWFSLFRRVDVDGSGLVSFFEFEQMVRKELKVAPSELSDGELRSVWVSLDDDGSGHVSAGEFGKFMRRGQEGSPATSTPRGRPAQRNPPPSAATQRDKSYELSIRGELVHRRQMIERYTRQAMELDSQLRKTGAHEGHPGINVRPHCGS